MRVHGTRLQLIVNKDAQTVAQRQIQAQARVDQIRQQQWKQSRKRSRRRSRRRRRLSHMAAAAYSTRHRDSERFGDGIKPFRTFNLTFLCIALRCVCAAAAADHDFDTGTERIRIHVSNCFPIYLRSHTGLCIVMYFITKYYIVRNINASFLPHAAAYGSIGASVAISLCN